MGITRRLGTVMVLACFGLASVAFAADGLLSQPAEEDVAAVALETSIPVATLAAGADALSDKPIDMNAGLIIAIPGSAKYYDDGDTKYSDTHSIGIGVAFSVDFESPIPVLEYYAGVDIVSYTGDEDEGVDYDDVLVLSLGGGVKAGGESDALSYYGRVGLQLDFWPAWGASVGGIGFDYMKAGVVFSIPIGGGVEFAVGNGSVIVDLKLDLCLNTQSVDISGADDPDNANMPLLITLGYNW